MSDTPGLRYAVAIDTGGTFTDVTLLDRETGRSWTAKTPSTPADPSQGFMTGIGLAVAQAGIAPADLGQVFHGTTVATNLILEGKGAPAGLLTTAGFRHVLEIGRQEIPRRANLFSWIKPTRPVPADRVFEVSERVAADGSVLTALEPETVRAAARTLKDRGIHAVAVCFLHSFANPAHERQARDLILAEHPEALVSLSSDVLPLVREYERSMATVLNVYVMPAVSRYVARLEERLAEENVTAPLLIMKSNGGVVSAPEVRTAPAYTALSGPAAGVVGAGFIGESAGFRNVIGIDIGGTSADISLIKNGQFRLSESGQIGEWPLALPMIDINTVGTGGGSIASLTATGALTVGPRSAGAHPGPACYGQGGERATVTDAHLVLGRLPPSLLGGGMSLDVAAARAAIERDVARPLGLSVEDAARGILAISNNDMVGAIRVISVERGEDPRQFALIPFGGAGPLHGSEMARLLGMTTLVVPPSPGVLSAIGLLVSTLRADYAQTCVEAPPYDGARIAATFRQLEQEADAWLARENAPADTRRKNRSASLRYRHQGFELTVDWPDGPVTEASMAEAVERFHRLHEQLYTFAQRDTVVELVNLRVSAACDLARPRLVERAAGGSLAEALVERHPVWFDEGPVPTPVYDRSRLGAGVRVDGPAILTQLDATTVLLPGETATVDRYGNLIVRTAK
ncbi:MAG: hydantoinase/oxoprolinase family protein [Alphaproteobacteria bacterium]|nr:hydantoinase/oxoprolinase family protein [Alphaproteobacteria bacterium]